MNERSDKRHKRRFVNFLDEHYVPGSGASSVDDFLKSSVESFQKISDQSQKLFAFSAIAFACFVIKAMGLRMDLIFIDKKIFEMPYGVFLFCASSQILYALAMLRSNDARFFDRIIRAVCETHYNDQCGIIHKSLVGSKIWGTPQIFALSHLNTSTMHKVISITSYTITTILGFALYGMPFFSGLYFLSNCKELSDPGLMKIQWYIILSTTAICGLSFLLNASFNFQDIDE